jgi:cytochrome d ubiquinol oxidase subunit II
MDLNTLWFVLVAVLFSGFFVLEGFDYGVGVLLPFVARTDQERRRVINTIGPVWDGNEVWIITGGGAIFAAFPHWYATLFSGFYLALFVILLALIVRGVSFEFRSKHRAPAWRATWDRAIFVGSLLPAVLWGTALANLLKGVPIDPSKTFTGSLLDLLSPYTLLAGLAVLAVFVTHGAIFLNLRSTDPIRERSHRIAQWAGPTAAVLVLLFAAGTRIGTDARGIGSLLVPLLGVFALLGAVYLVRRQRMGWAFVSTTLSVVSVVSTIFVALYPRVMVSSLDPAWSLTIDNAASSPYTLRVMTIVALIFVPVVLLYQGWTYWVFRHRIGAETKLEY